MLSDQENPLAVEIRPYRSKKQQPCDACRRRRVGCVKLAGQIACSLCFHRGNTCTYTTQPQAKKRRGKGVSNIYPPVSEGKGKEKEKGPSPSPHSRCNAPSLAALPTHPLQPLPPRNGIEDYERPSTVCRTTLIPGQTCLFSGASSDQDLYLLRHLPFDRENRFGKGNWRVWRLGPTLFDSAYFTIYPNNVMDAHIGVYDTSHVENIIKPHRNDLLDLYYQFVHPTLPILEPRLAFEEALQQRTVPASLFAAVCAAAVPFWSHSDALQDVDVVDRNSLAEFVFSSTGLESRTPTIRTVQALLLYLQLPPIIVREPNHPGYWASTAQLVAIAQDIGLHVEPNGWNIEDSEKKLRRILWWTVYMQDKWLAHWLGRPSHIQFRQFRTMPLTITDFTNQWGVLDGSYSSSTQSFVSLSHLTMILSDLMDGFYSLNSDASTVEDDAFRLSEFYRSQLAEWSNRHMFTPSPRTQNTNSYAVIFAYYAIQVSIQRGLSARQTDLNSTSGLADNIHLETLVEILENLDGRVGNGLWLSYCKGNIAIIGTFIVSLLLSSIDDVTFDFRRDLLRRYQKVLNDLSEYIRADKRIQQCRTWNSNMPRMARRVGGMGANEICRVKENIMHTEVSI